MLVRYKGKKIELHWTLTSRAKSLGASLASRELRQRVSQNEPLPERSPHRLHEIRAEFRRQDPHRAKDQINAMAIVAHRRFKDDWAAKRPRALQVKEDMAARKREEAEEEVARWKAERWEAEQEDDSWKLVPRRFRRSFDDPDVSDDDPNLR